MRSMPIMDWSAYRSCGTPPQLVQADYCDAAVMRRDRALRLRDVLGLEPKDDWNGGFLVDIDDFIDKAGQALRGCRLRGEDAVDMRLILIDADYAKRNGATLFGAC